MADATLLVAAAGSSDRHEWNETLDRLRAVDADPMGTVLLQPDSQVHATPSDRYAVRGPARWWVTEASRRSDSMAGESDVSAVASRNQTVTRVG